LLRKLIKIGLWTIATPLLLASFLFFLLWLPPVQQKVKDFATSALSEKTQGLFDIGNIRYRPFNSLRISDVLAFDTKGDTLAIIDEAEAGFDLFSFFRKQIVIRSVTLDGFDLRLSQDSVGGEFNFQFLVDAFASDTVQTDSASVAVNIDRILLKNGRLRYDLLSEARRDSVGVVDYNHISVSELNAEIGIPVIDGGDLDVVVKRLSMQENSGFAIDNLALGFRKRGDLMQIDGLSLNLPGSALHIDSAWVEWPDFAVPLFIDSLKAPDLSAFAPDLRAFDELLTGEATVEGRFPEIRVSGLKAAYGKHFAVSASAQTPDAVDFTKAAAEIRIDRFRYAGYDYRDIAVNADCEGDSIAFSIASADTNLLVNIAGNAVFSGARPRVAVQAALATVRPAALGLQTGFSGIEISGLLDVAVNGFDPEAMSLRLRMDSLAFATDSGKIDGQRVLAIYDATADRRKRWLLRTSFLDFNGSGQFSFAGIERSIRQAFPALFYRDGRKLRKPAKFNETVEMNLLAYGLADIAKTLGLPGGLPDSTVLNCHYEAIDTAATLQAKAFCLLNPTDTANLQLTCSDSQEAVNMELTAEMRSAYYNISALTKGSALLDYPSRRVAPAAQFNIDGGQVTLNGTEFKLHPAGLRFGDQGISVEGFALQHSADEYLKIDGAVSDNPQDSLLASVRSFEISTLLDALKYPLPLTGSASGDVSFTTLQTAPRFVTRNFTIDSIRFDGREIGRLTLTSGWSPLRQGVWFRSQLVSPEKKESLVSGFVRPEKDSLTVSGDISGLKANWLKDMTAGSLFGLDGEAGLRFQMSGLLSNPTITGAIRFDSLRFGVCQTNAVYDITDSIIIEPDRLVFSNFAINDSHRQKGALNGNIVYKGFTDIKPDLKLDLREFTVLDNATRTDSLFFGLLRVSGRLNITKDSRNWLVSGNLSNGRNNSLMFNIPQTPVEAQRYNWLTFTGQDSLATENVETVPATEGDKYFYSAETQRGGQQAEMLSIPLKFSASISLDPSLTIGALLNPATGDVAQAAGTGTVNLAYDLNNMQMSLQGNYVIDNGKCSMTLKNITRKTFTVSQGSRLVFRGDPMKTEFDVTAVYGLKADLTTLDAAFAEFVSYSKIPVNCLLTASGNLDKMKLSYNIALPDEPDDTQKKLDALVASDDAKIKQMAYLLAFGSFAPISNTGGNSSNIWTSLASSSVSSQLNNLLSGVLKDNWTIGTELQTGESGFSDVAMDVNISTNLFNNRLTVSSTIGYRNSAVQTDNSASNFTGDFDLEYKLSPGGNVLLRFFNLTNNQFYEKARMTQGAGIMYKRQGKTFRQLFKSFRTKSRRSQEN